MKDKIKVLIADDYKPFAEILKRILEKYDKLQVIGIASDDKEEIEKINQLEPDVVITDMLKNKKYTGLEIIKEYSNKSNSPYFFVLSSEINEADLKENSKVIGFMRKPMIDYDKMVKIILERFKMVVF